MNGNYIIVFNAGSYGSFISWYCLWLQGKFDANERPWSKANTAHGWNRKNFFETVDEAISQSTPHALVHPRTTPDCKLLDVLGRLTSSYSKIILLHPDNDTLMWNINNKYEKVYLGQWKDFLEKTESSKGNLLEHQLNNSTDILQWTSGAPENWQIREWLSYYSRPQHVSEVELDSIPLICAENVLKISLTDIRDRFHEVTDAIKNFLGIESVRDAADISLLHADWASRQVHQHKDVLIKHIVDCILSGKEGDMQDLTLVDQGEIQRVLRDDHGIEIRCYGLDRWPPCVSKLIPLLYKDEKYS